jgi:drug/metabolite transporter (DMT)-like permease
MHGLALVALLISCVSADRPLLELRRQRAWSPRRIAQPPLQRRPPPQQQQLLQQAQLEEQLLAARISYGTEPATLPPPSRALRTATLFAVCTAFSLWTDSITKHVLTRHQLGDRGTLTVSFFHFLMSTLVGAVVLPSLARFESWRVLNASRLRPRAAATLAARSVIPPSASRWPLLRLLTPLVLCQTLGFLCTNGSFKFVPISFSHTVKACECLFTATLAFLLLGQRLRPRAYAALVPTAAGVALSAANELRFSVAGFALAMSSNAFLACRSVLSSRALRSGLVTASQLYWLLCVGAALLMAPAFFLSGHPELLLSPKQRELLGELVLGGCTHFAYNLASMQLLQLTSPVTHVVLHALRRIIIIGGSATLSGQPLSPLNWGGVGIAFAGVVGYALASSGVV